MCLFICLVQVHGVCVCIGIDYFKNIYTAIFLFSLYHLPPMPSFLFPSSFSRSGFLSPGTIDFLSQIIRWRRGGFLCIVGCLAALWPRSPTCSPIAPQPPTPQSVSIKIVSRYYQMCLGCWKVDLKWKPLSWIADTEGLMHILLQLIE